jgi:hypothetical protein
MYRTLRKIVRETCRICEVRRAVRETERHEERNKEKRDEERVSK